MLLWIGVGLLAFILVLVVLAALRPAEMTVERRRTMACPPAAAFDQVDDFNRWRAWSPWAAMDPAMTITISGAPRGVGATYAWKGNKKVGEGHMAITASTRPSQVDIQLDFITPFRASNPTTFTFAPTADGGTAVTWRMRARSPLPMRVMGLFVDFDKLIGRDFERGLEAMARAAGG